MSNIKETPALLGFDEQQYLKFNVDVDMAVRKGEFLSGLSHYLSHGYYEKREGGPEKIDEKIKNLLDNSKKITIPPTHLRVRVHSDDISTYERIGRMVAFDIHSAIESYNAGFSQDGRILDFGCGCGRVISWLNYLYENASFFGTDIDEEAIEWCQSNLFMIGSFLANKNHPPFTYSDEYFNYVYSISVFTHLPENMQHEWLKELHRVTKLNGLLLLSVHGEQLFPVEYTTLKKQLMNDGFFYSVDKGTEGLPDFYKTTFHTESYIRSEWSQYFQIVDIIKNGIANYQDLIVCRKIT